MDKYGYIGIETLLNYCENSKEHAVTPNEFMRMNRVRMPEQQWIPVTERLPEEWKRVLIQNDEGLFLIGFTKDRGWGKEWFYQYEMYDYDAYVESEQGKIVAWCELPDRWKGEQE